MAIMLSGFRPTRKLQAQKQQRRRLLRGRRNGIGGSGGSSSSSRGAVCSCSTSTVMMIGVGMLVAVIMISYYATLPSDSDYTSNDINTIRLNGSGMKVGPSKVLSTPVEEKKAATAPLVKTEKHEVDEYQQVSSSLEQSSSTSATESEEETTKKTKKKTKKDKTKKTKKKKKEKAEKKEHDSRSSSSSSSSSEKDYEKTQVVEEPKETFNKWWTETPSTRANRNFPLWNPDLIFPDRNSVATTSKDNHNMITSSSINLVGAQQNKCLDTLIYPFVNGGCPSSCSYYRPGMGRQNDDVVIEEPSQTSSSSESSESSSSLPWSSTPGREPPLYSMNVGWDLLDSSSASASKSSSSSFSKTMLEGTNHVKKRIVVHEYEKENDNSMFGDASSFDIRQYAKAPQLHLADLCCIHPTEQDGVQNAIDEWITTRFMSVHQRTLQNLDLTFDHVSCWRGNKDSFYTVLTADTDVQRTLLQIYMDLMEHIDRSVPTYNPLVVPIQDQMPFHVNLFDIHYDDEESINRVRPDIADRVLDLARTEFESLVTTTTSSPSTEAIMTSQGRTSRATTTSNLRGNDSRNQQEGETSSRPQIALKLDSMPHSSTPILHNY